VMQIHEKGVTFRDVTPRRGYRFVNHAPLPRVCLGAGKWWKLGEMDVLWSG
jgi:hypothetical protein